jgi:glucose/arabinose dehydrogenase
LKSLNFVCLAALTLPFYALPMHAAKAPKAPQIACDADNGGIKLPPGFCAKVVATDLGVGRHMALAANGDLYVSLMGAGRRDPGGVIALRDADGDGTYETKEQVTTGSSTGIAIHNGYLYIGHQTSIERFKLTPGTLKPTGDSEIVATLPKQNEHEDKGLAFDGKGNLYTNVGAPSNACQTKDRIPADPGQDPCPLLAEHAGIWKFDENKLNQTEKDGTRYATGLRQMPALTWHDGLIIVMNNRDQLDTMFPAHFTAEDNAYRPAEPMYKAIQGSDFGWPYCFYDYKEQKLIQAPEYGGDGKIATRCANYTLPIASYPAHWAPVDVTFYDGKQFPAHYRDGAFIAFHGSWNRAPLPQEGYNITFQPFSHGKPSGKYEVFASGFTGQGGADSITVKGRSQYRPDGVTQAPDGSLFIIESEKGKIWHVFYRPTK